MLEPEFGSVFWEPVFESAVLESELCLSLSSSQHCKNLCLSQQCWSPTCKFCLQFEFLVLSTNHFLKLDTTVHSNLKKKQSYVYTNTSI